MCHFDLVILLWFVLCCSNMYIDNDLRLSIERDFGNLRLIEDVDIN